MDRKKKMIVVLFSVAVVIVAGIAVSYFFFFSFSRSCNPPLPRKTVQVGDSAFSAEVAGTIAERSCGLSGRSGLGDGEGMIFPFGISGMQSFWMKDMNFPLDMIWIGSGKVLGFAENAAPQPNAPLWGLKIYNSPWGTDTVLEVNAGTVRKLGIKVGDAVRVGA